jgi:glucosamine 6-phosphate synthetase-like amidotransferase/phosphosugar isomerase protein
MNFNYRGYDSMIYQIVDQDGYIVDKNTGKRKLDHKGLEIRVPDEYLWMYNIYNTEND